MKLKPILGYIYIKLSTISKTNDRGSLRLVLSELSRYAGAMSIPPQNSLATQTYHLGATGNAAPEPRYLKDMLCQSTDSQLDLSMKIWDLGFGREYHFKFESLAYASDVLMWATQKVSRRVDEIETEAEKPSYSH